MQHQGLTSQIEQLLQHLNNEREQDEQQPKPEGDEPEEIIDVYFIKREAKLPEDQIVDVTPQNRPPSQLFTAAAVIFCLIIPISSILFQLSLVFNPPIATVTIIPNVQTFTLNSTVQLGRMVHPITLSQSATIPTTGKGHQDATQATGTLTFYNASFSSQTVNAGSLFIGADGIKVQTDAIVSVPANNPPQDGEAQIEAHASNPGNQGNIQALDINGVVSSSLFVKNLTPFTNGQDARDFQTVAKGDISNATTPMKTTLAQSIKGALQGQLQAGGELVTLPCSPTVASNHQAGDEATRVTVTVSQTCSGIAYNSEELKAHATQQLTSQAIKRLGAGYSLLGESQVTVTQITTGRPTPTLTFSSQGSFVYGLSARSQERMKTLIAGKTKQEALHILSSVPGIKNISLQWDEDTKLPKDPQQIKLLVIVNL
jgi:Baseplate J-like protein